jgi:glycerol-3-phosphate O-acyltransferase
MRNSSETQPDHPLAALSRDSEAVIEETVRRVVASYSSATAIEEAVADSLFWERKRLEKSSDALRDAVDSSFWKDVGTQLLSAGEAQEEMSRFLLKKIARHHAEEISGNFNPRVYGFATAAVPRGMGWLLQAFSWKSFRNLFVENVDLRRKIHLQGETRQLQELAKKGTVVLVPTHFSNLDSVLIGWALFELGLPPFVYGAGLNLFTNPVLGYFMNNLGAPKLDLPPRNRL